MQFPDYKYNNAVLRIIQATFVFLTAFFILQNVIAQNQVKEESIDPSKNPVYPEIYYEYRITELNLITPIEIEYNTYVKEYIDIFSVKRKDDFAQIIGLSRMYFPIFEEALDRHGIPLEFKYLPVIESGLNPLAVSKSGAVGLWQFLYGTCSLFELNVTSYIDERRDPYKSTEAACKYVNYLYHTFNDWLLVLAAYNSGPGEVRKAIERSGGKTNYWEIRPYLSEQAQNYVPAFIAAYYLLNNYTDHAITPQEPIYSYHKIDTLWINYPISFQQISEMIPISMDTLKWLNPAYKLEYIPAGNQKCRLVLPQHKILDYIRQEGRIIANREEIEDYFSKLEKLSSTEDKVQLIHTVQKGEYFHKIAIKYNCSIESIKYWNDLDTNNIYPGQKLIIWISEDD